MASYHIIAAIFVSLLFSPDGIQGQAANNDAANQCKAVAGQILTNCTQQMSLSFPNFLWFVTNGTSSNGQEPSDKATFKTNICDMETRLGGCIINQVVPIANVTPCNQAPQILSNVESLLITYDSKCAHPCRKSLKNDLRQCYVTSGLDASLFLSNRTGGQVIGKTEDEVTDFCMKKDKLINCMTPVHNNCPEALPILARDDFHFPSYTTGIKILCSHPKVYLKGLECFAERTDKVNACIQQSQQAFVQATVEARAKKWTQDQFIKSTCKITIDQTNCDLDAWSVKKHEACNKATIGLRREIECSLMPPNCTRLQEGLFKAACKPEKFHKGHRDNFGKPGSGSSVTSLPAALLLPVFALLFPVMAKINV